MYVAISKMFASLFLGVVGATWRKRAAEERFADLDDADRLLARAAYTWLCENNPTYMKYVKMHESKLNEARWNTHVVWWIPTAKLLLQNHGPAIPSCRGVAQHS